MRTTKVYWGNWLAAGAVALSVLAALVSLSTERPGVDESLFADPAVALLRQGSFASPHLDPAGLPGIDRHTYWIHPLQPLLLSAVFFVGGVSVFAQRTLSLLFAILLLWSWRQIARVLFPGSAAAAWIVPLLACDYLFLIAASWGRMDMMTSSLGWLGAAVYLKWRERHLHHALLAGHACVCLSGLTHPNGVFFFFILLVLTWIYDRDRISFRLAVFCLVPYCVGALAWGLYIAQDPASFLAQYRANASDGDRMRVLREPWNALRWELGERYAQAFGLGQAGTGRKGLASLKALVWVFYWVAPMGAWFFARDCRKGLLRLAAVFGILFGALTFLDGQKMFYYLVYLTPVYVCFLAVCLSAVASLPDWKKRVAWPVAALFCMLGLAGVFVRARSQSYRLAYAPAAGQLMRQARPNEIKQGNPIFLYALDFSPSFQGDMSLGYRSGIRADWLALDEEFNANLALARARNPLLHRHLERTLAACELSWRSESFRVYDCRRGNATAAQSP